MPDSVYFHETMRGWLSPSVDAPHEDAERVGHEAGTPGQFVLTVLTPDVDALRADPDHRSPAYGCVLVPTLHARPLRVEDGHLDLFVDADATGRVVHMRYGLRLRADDGQRWFLRGVKVVVHHRWWPTVLYDTTTLYTDVFVGDTAIGRPVLRGILRMGPIGVTAQGLSFRGAGGWGGLRGIVRYLAYYVSRVLHVYLGPRTDRPSPLV